VYIDGKTLSSEDLMNAVLLKALCEECADGMKAEYGTKQAGILLPAENINLIAFSGKIFARKSEAFCSPERSLCS